MKLPVSVVRSFDDIQRLFEWLVGWLEANQRPTIVGGVVNADGTINFGPGFSSVKNATGNYSVTFSTAFADRPTVIPVGIGRDASLQAAPSATGFGVSTYTSAGAAVDAAFTFLAIL